MVSEADGYQPHLIAPEQGYRSLIEGSLNYFRGPVEVIPSLNYDEIGIIQFAFQLSEV